MGETRLTKFRRILPTSLVRKHLPISHDRGGIQSWKLFEIDHYQITTSRKIYAECVYILGCTVDMHILGAHLSDILKNIGPSVTLSWTKFDNMRHGLYEIRLIDFDKFVNISCNIDNDDNVLSATHELCFSWKHDIINPLWRKHRPLYSVHIIWFQMTSVILPQQLD